MKYIFLRFLLITLAITVLSCEGEDGMDGINGEDGVDGVNGSNDGLEFLVFAGDVTNEEATQIIAENFGKNTHTLLVINTTELTSLELPDITSLVRLEVKDNKTLQSIAIPNLTSVTQDIDIYANDVLASINLEALSNVSRIDIENNATLTNVNLNALSGISGIQFRENQLLETLAFPVLKEINFLRLRSLPNLSNLDLNTLETAGSISLTSTKMSSFILPKLTTLSSSLSLSSNEDMISVTIPLLANSSEDGADISIQSNTNLTTINLGNLDKIERFTINNNQNLSLFEANELVAITNRFTLSNNENLSSFSLPKLVSIPSLTISQSNLLNINFDALQEISFISIEENEKLEALAFSSLTKIDRITISENKIVSSISFDALETIEGSLTISDNENLKTIIFPNLTSINNSLSIGLNTALETLSFPLLSSTGGDNPEIRSSFSVFSNTLLNNLDFPNLVTVNGSFVVSSNNALSTIVFPLLTSVGNDVANSFLISDNTVTSITFPSLEFVNKNIREISIRENVLEMLDFAKLATFNILDVDSSTILTSVNISSAQDFFRLELESPGSLSNAAVESVLNQLVSITPAITGKSIRIKGVLSAQAITDRDTLVANGNSISIR